MPDNVLGIIGHPVAHSLSPLMHNFAAKKLGLPYTYVAFDVEPAQLKKAVEGLRALGIAGVNVTVPHKVKVMKHLDGITQEARDIGAVNTVINRNGKLSGTNTDGIGFLRSLENAKFMPKGKTAVVIGSGGSSRAIGVSLLRAGVKRLTVISRRSPAGLVKVLRAFGSADFILSGSPLVPAALRGADLVVQATPLGMKKGDPLPLRDPAFRKGQLVYDIIYAPVETRFLAAARKAGADTMNGLAMLVYQGSESFRLWTGKKFPEDAALKLLKAKLGRT
ncbi:MAG: shikimate dehydrogenase [Nitrospinae bacterium]|nr:shikimate dehydrogenase [Nitrospinota bacterium]